MEVQPPFVWGFAPVRAVVTFDSEQTIDMNGFGKC